MLMKKILVALALASLVAFASPALAKVHPSISAIQTSEDNEWWLVAQSILPFTSSGLPSIAVRRWKDAASGVSTNTLGTAFYQSGSNPASNQGHLFDSR